VRLREYLAHSEEYNSYMRLRSRAIVDRYKPILMLALIFATVGAAFFSIALLASYDFPNGLFFSESASSAAGCKVFVMMSNHQNHIAGNSSIVIEDCNSTETLK